MLKIATFTPGWSPAIGDPTATGWTSVVLYYVIALISILHIRSHRSQRVPHGRFAWFALGVLFIALGANKQFDLLSAGTAFVRTQLRFYETYQHRNTFGPWLVVGMLTVMTTAFAIAAMKMRVASGLQRVSMGLACIITAFVLLRSASLHDIDQMLRATAAGVRWNTIIELGLLLIIATMVLRHQPHQRYRLGP
ncbi:MAG: hypothetical protein AAF432_04115 [Planctomycetota bacterium]